MPASEPHGAESLGPPAFILAEAEAAAAANQEEEKPPKHHPLPGPHHPHDHDQHRLSVSQAPEDESEKFPSIENVPQPAYGGADYGQLDISQNGMDSGARIAKDGRVEIKINQRNRKLTNLLVPALRKQLDLHQQEAAKESAQYIPPGLAGVDGLPPPPMNIVIQIVGSRGDVQPFVALGQVLKNKYHHRVRIATHPTFKSFVTDNGLEFFSIGGDPAELMAFMVKNPGLMPGMESLKAGDIGKRRKGIYEMITGCWRSCVEAGDGTGVEIGDEMLSGRASFDATISVGGNPLLKPFVADAIIANPPSFAHMHIAEKLGIPLHLMFTMPWSPTQAFPHPLANILSSNADANMTNFISYALVDMMTWQGLGDVINRFREKSLGLEPVSVMWAPGMASRLRIPYTYCWSPALIPKPKDWGNYIDISGFYFLNLSTNYTPAADLEAFLKAGPPPVYIGFGSIVVDDPNAMTKMIFEAVKKTGQRALVSKGWGGLGADEFGVPDGVFMLGNCPHDWLFQHVSAVVHHGGAGTTAAGISAGRPTVVVPFFGDQPFWGAMCARAGAGPFPIPYKELSADKLANQINKALEPASLERAAELSKKIRSEDGNEGGAQSFHKQLHLDNLRCSLYPERVAVWRVKRTDIRLSALAATVLGNEGLLDFSDLKLFRGKEYLTDDGPWDPISGGAAALIGTIGSLGMGFADFPVEVLKSLKGATADVKEERKHRQENSSKGTSPAASNTPTTSSPMSSKTDLALQQEQSYQSTRQPSLTPTLSHDSITSAGTATTNDKESAVDGSVAPPSLLSPSQSLTQRPSQTVIAESQPHRRWSRHGSRSGSRSGSPAPGSGHNSHDSADNVGKAAGHITVEGAIASGKAINSIVQAGVKSPIDFTNALARGFHNAPKLYGDDTVRETEKVTDFQSGVKAASKEFGYGLYDGITGLVTQPLQGAKKGGASGFFKGAAKGMAGFVLKPSAAMWGLPGYTFKGIYAEVGKMFGHSVQNYIIAARTAQGYEEWRESTPQQRLHIVNSWKSTQIEMRRHGKKYGKERDEELHELATHTRTNTKEAVFGFKATRHLSWDDRKRLDQERRALEKERKEQKQAEQKVRKGSGTVKSRCKYCPFDHDSDLHRSQTFPTPEHPLSLPPGNVADEYEEAIKRSVTSTSRGNPQEDAIIERAIRASVLELQAAQASGEIKAGMYEKAIAASVMEAKRARGELTVKDEKSNPMETEDPVDEDDAELTKALQASLEETHISDANPHHHHHQDENGDWSSDSGMGTDDDEDFKKTLEESKRLHTERQGSLGVSETTGVTSPEEWGQDHDKELKRAITESENAHRTRVSELATQKTEEEVVLEYVKKQSLLEQEHKERMQGIAST